MTRWSMPSKRPARRMTPGAAASSRTIACVSGSPRGERQIAGASGARARAASMRAATTSARSTMPAPPPAGVSSTWRWRPRPKSRNATVSRPHSPRFRASPASEAPSGPGNSSGNSVTTVAARAGRGCSGLFGHGDTPALLFASHALGRRGSLGLCPVLAGLPVEAIFVSCAAGAAFDAIWYLVRPSPDQALLVSSVTLAKLDDMRKRPNASPSPAALVQWARPEIARAARGTRYRSLDR